MWFEPTEDILVFIKCVPIYYLTIGTLRIAHVIDMLFVCVSLRKLQLLTVETSVSASLYAERYFHVLTKAVGMSE